jgi:hypothetical protein
MADAIPVTPTEEEEVVAPKKSKGASAAISPDVLAELRAQVKEDVLSEMKPKAMLVELADASFKVKGGVGLDSHKATREDF